MDSSVPMELDKEVFVMQKAKKAFLNKEKTFSYTVNGTELQRYNQWRNSLVGKKKWDESEAVCKKSWHVNAVFFSRGMMGISYDSPATEEAAKLLERFAGVFDLTFTRFLDLQKAEAQARESQIELALERVRAKTMAMHKSSDLLEVINVLADQFQILGFKVHSANFNTSYRDRDWNLWLYNPGTPVYPDKIHVPYFDHPFFNRTLEALASGSDFNAFVFTREEKDSFFDHLYTHTIARNAPEERKKLSYAAPGFAWSAVYLKNTALTIVNYDAEPYTEEQNAIIRRFGNVFEQSYTRFLDLQKAEAQVREAQIEAALERVRSRTMAMFKSDELAETAVEVFKQMNGLGIIPNRLYIVIINDDSGNMEFWVTDENGDKIGARHPVNINENITLKTMFEGWVTKKKSIIIDQQGNELQDWFTYWKENFHI